MFRPTVRLMEQFLWSERESAKVIREGEFDCSRLLLFITFPFVGLNCLSPWLLVDKTPAAKMSTAKMSVEYRKSYFEATKSSFSALHPQTESSIRCVAWLIKHEKG